MKLPINPGQLMGVGAIALVVLLSSAPASRAETDLPASFEANRATPLRLSLNEMTTRERQVEEDGASAATDPEQTLPSPAQASNNAGAGQTHGESRQMPSSFSELEETEEHLILSAIDNGAIGVEPFLLPDRDLVEMLHPPLEFASDTPESAQIASAADDRRLKTQSLPERVSEGTGKATEEGLQWGVENRAELLQPLEIAQEVREDNADGDDADKSDWPSPIHDNQVFWLVLVDELEYRFNDGTDALNWDAIAWVGGDYQRLWIETEGEIGVAGDGSGEAELQVLYGRLVSPFWDFQAGLRYDQVFGPGRDPGRAFAVIGIQGLAPYLFEIDASLFISEDGDVSARFETEYQFLLTQRLILQPELEVNVAAQQVEEFGVGSGLNDIELSLRLRYEVSRQFAPYVGVSWTRKFGQTAEFAREEGESTDNFAVVGGLRLLF